MALSTIQKVAVFSGLVLCVSLLLPKTFLSRGKLPAQPEGGSGRFPSATPHGKTPEGRNPGTPFPRSHLSEAVSKSKIGGGGGGRQSLVGQIIPIYGFGILLYILYILFKLSSRGKNAKVEPKSVPIGNGNLKRKITDYELGQLQDKLRETEEAMEKIILRLGPDRQRENDVSADEEQQLLQRLKEITRVMKEGKVMDGVSPEQEAEDAPYMEDWEGYPEETFPVYEASASRRKPDTILVDRSVLTQPSAEEIAEQMGFGQDEDLEDGEEMSENCIVGHDHSDSPAYSPMTQTEVGGAETWCDSEEEEDPAILAENAGFSSDSGSEAELETTTGKELPGATGGPLQDDVGILRKRGKKGSEY